HPVLFPLLCRRRPRSTLFPYTTLFRSSAVARESYARVCRSRVWSDHRTTLPACGLPGANGGNGVCDGVSAAQALRAHVRASGPVAGPICAYLEIRSDHRTRRKDVSPPWRIGQNGLRNSVCERVVLAAALQKCGPVA